MSLTSIFNYGRTIFEYALGYTSTETNESEEQNKPDEKSQKKDSFSNLPEILQLKICKYLKASDLRLVAKVNKALNQAATEQIKELAAEVMKNPYTDEELLRLANKLFSENHDHKDVIKFINKYHFHPDKSKKELIDYIYQVNRRAIVYENKSIFSLSSTGEVNYGKVR